MKTYLDWSAYRESGQGDAYADIPKHGDDFARAVAVCINSRQCENTGKGVMCPSYRASGDPALSTGARVKLLKKALNSEDPVAALDDPALQRAMTLCVSCKGCKRECENEVDMAQIKLEYLAQYHARTSPSWRTRLFAHLPRWQHRLPWLGNLLTLRNRLPLLARAGQSLLGIRADRTLPEPAAEPFSASTTAASGENGEVVLFVDTFTHLYEPQIAHSAIAVLHAAGYTVHIAQSGAQTLEPERPLCCGRTFLAHGLLRQAREEAQRTLDILQPYAEAGLSIIGLEPACLLALRDDYRALDLGESAEQVSERAILFEEFIAREITAKRWQLDFPPQAEGAEPVLVHGHCHQKAVGAMKSMRKVLKRIPGLKYEFIDASCCGGAGSFYLEAEHAALADSMAEDALLPRLRRSEEARLVANGFACRRQIVDNTEHRPHHLALLLDEILQSAPIGDSVTATTD